MLKRCPCLYDGMEGNDSSIGDFSRNKLTKVPESVLNRGRHLEELYLDSNDIEVLPKGVFQLSKLRVLSVSDNNLCKLPAFVGNLVCLEKLDVSKNCISGFPDNIVRCTDLAHIDASLNPIAKLSDGLISLPNLTHLILNETFLESLPEHFGWLSRLKVLEIRHNHLHLLPKSLRNLKELERLDIGDNKFINLPVAIGYLPKLEELLADCNMIEEIPPVIGLLKNLTFLELSKNKLECLPPEMEALENLTDLYLSVNELLELPENIGSLKCLQTLKLDENDLIFLPPSVGGLENLEELDVTANNLEGLPPSIGQLKRLRILTLDNNCIKSIPEELGDCSSLSLLSLHSNELINIPETIGHLENLQMIKMSANMLTSLPLSFLGLTHLKALWLSENQSKPVVPLQKVYNEKTKQFVLSCYLLPQEFCGQDESGNGEEDGGMYVTSNDKHGTNSGEDNVGGDKEPEVVRTTGSISQALVSGNHLTKDADKDETKPWYEQEFIENTEVFPDQDEVDDDDGEEKDKAVVSADENRSRAQIKNISLHESFPSRYSFEEEQPSSLNELVNMTSSMKVSSANDAKPFTFLDSTGIANEQDITHSYLKSPPSSLLSPRLTSSALSSELAGVSVTGLSADLIESSLLAPAGTDDDMYRNTSPLIVSSPVQQPEDSANVNSVTDHSSTLSGTDDEANMRLRFSNKRNRSGNPLCQYEAFKPTRFNLYQGDELAWESAVKDPLDASSPKKKSVSSTKDNPLIGARLAVRDESPMQSGVHNQKYEEKIRAIQQQRLKERSRRRNNSARVEYRGEQQREAAYMQCEPPLSPLAREVDNDDVFRQATGSHYPPPAPQYVISDDHDAPAIKLTDFTLASLQPEHENGKNLQKLNANAITENTASVVVQQQSGRSPPPVEFNRFAASDAPAPRHNNATATASHYYHNSEESSRSILHVSEIQSTSYDSHLADRSVLTRSPCDDDGGEEAHQRQQDYRDRHHNNDFQSRDVNQTSHGNWRENNGPSFSEDPRQRETAGNYSNFSQFEDQRGQNDTIRVSSELQHITSPRSDFTSDTSSEIRGVRVRQLSPPLNSAVQHVTVKSTQIERPVSPRLVMAAAANEKMTANDNGKRDITFKEFRPNCTVEDVASFLVRNITEDAGTEHAVRNQQSDSSASHIIHEQVSVDSDIEEVTRNISKHLVEICRVDEAQATGSSEVKVRVTDLDMPDAACPLSSRGVRANPAAQKCWQVITVSDEPREEIQLRVFRSPILGFSIGGGQDKEGQEGGTKGIYVVAVKPEGPSFHLLKPGDRILEVNKLDLRDVSHEHAVLFLTHNQQLDLLIERVVQE